MMLKVEIYWNIFIRFMLPKSIIGCFFIDDQIFLIENMLLIFTETNFTTELDWVILRLIFLG
jgi:hypothetical protein